MSVAAGLTVVADECSFSVCCPAGIADNAVGHPVRRVAWRDVPRLQDAVLLLRRGGEGEQKPRDKRYYAYQVIGAILQPLSLEITCVLSEIYACLVKLPWHSRRF